MKTLERFPEFVAKVCGISLKFPKANKFSINFFNIFSLHSVAKPRSRAPRRSSAGRSEAPATPRPGTGGRRAPPGAGVRTRQDESPCVKNSQSTNAQKPGKVSKFRGGVYFGQANFIWLVLGCIEAGFCNQIFV